MKMAVEHVSRRILLLGKTGAGKATLANHITGTTEFKVHDALESITRIPVLSDAVQVGSPDHVQYIVKLLDTTGLERGPRVTRQEAVREIKTYCVEKGGESDVLILFVVAYGRFTDEEWDIFRYIVKKLSKVNLSSFSALIVTKCEDLSEEARKELVSEIHRSAQTTAIAKFMSKGIHPVGFPNPTKLKLELRDAYKEWMEKDELTLQQLFTDIQIQRLDKDSLPVQPSTKNSRKCMLM